MKSKLLLVVVAITLLLAACSPAAKNAAATPTAIPTVVADSTIIAEGRLQPVRYAEIAFNASGVVSDALVDEGQLVTKGQPLIKLGDESDTNYAAAQLELANAKKALSDLQSTAGTDLAQTVIDLKQTQEDYDKAADYLHFLENSNKVPLTQTKTFLLQTWKGYEYRYSTKSYKGRAPQDWIIEARNDLALKKAKLDETQRAYDRMKGGVDAEQLAVLEARLEAAKAGVAAFSVIAPFDGVVAKLTAKQGSSISAGQTAITVADFSNWVVKTTDVTEIDVVKLKVGQPVIITLDALPEKELAGTIQAIGQTFAQNQGDIVYEVTVVLNDVDPAMRWGMTAAVKFENQD